MRREREEELNRMQEALNRVVETHRTPNGMLIVLPDSTFRFDFDSAELSAKNRELLSRVAGILLVSKGYGLSVFGYTDDVGSEQYNQQLSERRAKAVEDYLIQAGIDPIYHSRERLWQNEPAHYRDNGFGARAEPPRRDRSHGQLGPLWRRHTVAASSSLLSLACADSPGETRHRLRQRASARRHAYRARWQSIFPTGVDLAAGRQRRSSLGAAIEFRGYRRMQTG